MALHSGMAFGMQYHLTGNPIRQPLTKAVVQTSINNLNVFKSFQLMLAPPSTLLSNAVKFTCINACGFKDLLASMSSDDVCHHSSNIKTHGLSTAIMSLRHVIRFTKEARPCLKIAEINQPDSSPKTYRLHIKHA